MEFFRVTLIAVGFVVAALAVGVAFLATVIIGAVTPLMLIAWAFYRGWQESERIRNSLPKLRELFQPKFWISAGQSKIDGIVLGLRSGVNRLRAAVTGVAANALGSFRSALGIHSPSTVFARLGVAIPQGVAEGVERGSTEATNATGTMMSTTTNNVSTVRGGPSRALTTGDIHIHVEGGEDTARRVTDALREFFDASLATEPV